MLVALDPTAVTAEVASEYLQSDGVLRSLGLEWVLKQARVPPTDAPYSREVFEVFLQALRDACVQNPFFFLVFFVFRHCVTQCITL